ncbi:MAG: chloride channel protein [Halieaceae bacterium]
MLQRQYAHYFQDYRALLPYSLLGLIAGVCSALAVMGFEGLIRFIGSAWLTSSPDGFEALPDWQRFAIPVAGAMALGLVFSLLRPEDREVGIVHVISRMHSHYGQLPLRNALVQFIGGAIALASGQSGGREGPSVHLGAAISSSIARGLRLPNNSQRILIACGTAGSIAAAFNTPLAGVVFAMEVIVTEYTVVGFTPVILAAISATTVHHVFDRASTTFVVPAVEMASLLELPFILLLGVIAGVVISLFTMLVRRGLSFARYPIFLRFTVAGVITGSLGVVVPEVLGMGYDSLNLALTGQLAPTLLATLIVVKVIATACSVGLGLPVGLIGPSLLIGGCIGGFLGYWGAVMVPDFSSHPSLYVVIGMGAAMAAVLNAPLAALLAIVELTQNVLAVFPSMLAIIAATLTVTVVFRQRSAHQAVLNDLRREIPDDPISQLLHQTAVLSAMDRSISTQACWFEKQAMADIELSNWCLLSREEERLFLVRGDDISQLVSQIDEDAYDLTEHDLRRWTFTTLSSRATLREALDALRAENAEAVIITDPRVPGELGVLGVITRDIIDQFYLRRF